MLSVAPTNLARAAYHERSLGHGLDDYYSEWGERPGIWWGGGADLLGLEGHAAPGSIVRLFEELVLSRAHQLVELVLFAHLQELEGQFEGQSPRRRPRAGRAVRK